MIMIILITNKMKIITQFSLFGQLLHRSAPSFSNLIKDPKLTFEDLSTRPQKPLPQSPNKPFNITQTRFADNTLIDTHVNLSSKKNEQKTLDLMIQNLNKQAVKKALPVFRNQNIDRDTQIENAINFMKYLDHSLERAQALEVVVMIEKYCSRNNHSNKLKSTWPIPLEKKVPQSKDASQELFKNIRDNLVHNLNFFSQNTEGNNKLIDSLFDILVESDPTYITVDNFQQECFTLDEEERRQQVTGSQYFEAYIGARYFQQKEAQPVTAEQKEKTKYKSALEEAFQLKDGTKFSKLHLKKVSEVAEDSKLEPKLKVASDKIIFRKKDVNKSIVSKATEEEDLKSAYIYQLPFNITEQEANQFIHFLQSSKNIKVESFVLFPYKDFIQRNHHEITFKIPEDRNGHIEKVLKVVEIDELTRILPAQKKKQYVSKSKSKSKSKFDDVPLENEPSRMKSVTDALLLKIKKENYSKFNKSSMLIKFASKKDKEAVLTKEARLYGLNYKNFKNVKFQQGYCKSTISLSGFPWGCGSKQLQKHLNKILQPEKIPIKVQQNCILTKNNIIIQFDYLSQAFLAIQKLNGTSFQNKQLKAYLTYGSVKLFNNKYDVNAEDSYEKLKQKIRESSAYYEKKYESEGAKPE